MKTTQSSVAY